MDTNNEWNGIIVGVRRHNGNRYQSIHEHGYDETGDIQRATPNNLWIRT